MKYYLFMFFILLISVGCIEVQPFDKQLQDIGLIGQHELKRIEQAYGLDGEIHGSSSLFSGFSLDGKITSQKKLQFYWGRTAEEYISTTLPYNKFRFIVSDKTQVPTVEFMFNPEIISKKCRIFKESEKLNPNYWIEVKTNKRDSLLCVVNVYISKTDLENGVYLQDM